MYLFHFLLDLSEGALAVIAFVVQLLHAGPVHQRLACCSGNMNINWSSYRIKVFEGMDYHALISIPAKPQLKVTPQ